MRNMAFYDKLSKLNDELYQGAKDFGTWKLLDTYEDKTGILITLYDIGNNETLFCVKGTDVSIQEIKATIKDLGADGKMLFGFIPAQAKSAQKYYEQIKNKYKNIIFTGYSLGASVVQILASQYNNETITFEAYGIKHLINCNPKNIINFGNNWDPIFMCNFINQVGNIYIIPGNKNTVIINHFPHHYGKPSQATKLNISKLEYLKQASIRQIHKSTNRLQKYIKQGIIPNVTDRINQFKNHQT